MTTEKTLFLVLLGYETDSLFFELEGNYSHFHEVYINGTKEDLWDELTNILYKNDGSGEYRLTPLKEPSKDWTHFVKCGFFG